MKIVFALFLSHALVISCFAQSDTVTATYKYMLGDNDTRNDARRISLIEAKRICIEKAGTYLEGQFSRNVSETINNGESNFSDVTKSDIATFIGALVKVEVVDEKFGLEGSNQFLITKVKATINIQDIYSKLKQIKGDDELQAKLLKQQDDLNSLHAQLTELQSRINKMVPDNSYTARGQRNEIFKEIDGLDAIRFEMKKISEQAVSNVDIGMTYADVKKLAGTPRVEDKCVSESYWNYGDVWIIFSSGTVAAIVKTKDWMGSCYPLYYYKSHSIK